jgi:serine/threonine protein kinase
MRDAKNVDRRADIFSLGAVLYELVTGRMAFPGDDLVALMNNITQGIYIRPRTLVPDLPEAVEEAICGAMEIDRDKRIADCQRLMATWTGGDETDSRVFLRPRRSQAPVALAGLDAPERAPAEPESIAVLVRSQDERDRFVRGLGERGITVRAVDRNPATSGQPLVMTMHRAKGMEFSRVILSGADDKHVPSPATLRYLPEEEKVEALLRVPARGSASHSVEPLRSSSLIALYLWILVTSAVSMASPLRAHGCEPKLLGSIDLCRYPLL